MEGEREKGGRRDVWKLRKMVTKLHHMSFSACNQSEEGREGGRAAATQGALQFFVVLRATLPRFIVCLRG